MTEISILGAGGLTGRELLRLLNHHPEFEVVHITSNQQKGKSFQESYPQDRFSKSLIFRTHDSEIPEGSTVVLATPNDVSLDIAPKLLSAGHKVIDLSGSYRLHDKDIFNQSYGLEHKHWNLMETVKFGIPEIFRNQISGSSFVSNPGCYATASLLPLRMILETNISDGNVSKEPGLRWIDRLQSPVIVDASSGVSGAGGRTEDVGFSFTNTYENFRAYKILKHQHEPEIKEYGLGIYEEWGNPNLDLVFTPHLLPVYRGILATIYLNFDSEESASLVPSILEAKTQNETFIRYRKEPEEIELKNVQNTNYMDVSVRSRGKSCVIVSAIDNLLKGAAGQALQNLNLMHGYPETMGLI